MSRFSRGSARLSLPSWPNERFPARFSSGESVFAEGEPCTGLYVVESGHIRIFKSSAGGREHVLGIEGPGSSVAELPVLMGELPSVCDRD